VEIAILPLDLARWDEAPGGDLFAIPVCTDVRPLRGAAGLLDWRLNGQLSSCLRDERFHGTVGEKLLLPTRRVPWSAVLAVGIGDSSALDDDRVRSAASLILATARGLGQRRLAIAPPGRDLCRGPAELDRVVALLLSELLARGNDLRALTVVDTTAALKMIARLLGISGAKRPSAQPAVKRG
jgi:hypothetical protein